jgi:DNA-binding MarR family transcriptional regulator
MNLEQFFPYRLVLVAESVSLAIALVYAERFKLTRDEWRVIASLADLGEVKTARLLERTALDKMRISRAVARLERDGLLVRSADPQDGRGFLLRLLAPGRTLYGRIVPMVQAREAFLLEALDGDEREVFQRALSKVQERAEQLARQG